ncbi:MAG: nodulation protein NfeD [SAR202 cluster bacterium]|nr:nodulation protein NfeD [SAR202 cluster bacterium]
MMKLRTRGLPVRAKSPFSKPLRFALLALCLISFALGLTGLAAAQGQTVYVAEVDGMINSVTQRYIQRAIDKGEEDNAEVVIVALDTPGGLLSSTRKIVEALLEAEVPTVVYVSPSGAHAASAGTFITAAAHFAVMAPGTNIGAATPVGGGGEDLPDTLADKATNDAAALMRSIAAERGRNAEKLEATVLEATSYSANEALDLNIINFTASSLEDLLSQLHGRQVTLSQGIITLDTQDADVKDLNMGLINRFLFILADPNIAFLLLSLGGLGLVIEIINPGLIFPGVLGAILIALAFVSLGNLPVNWAGVALILLAAALFVTEFYVSGFGLLGVGAIVSFIIGSLLLFAHFGAPSPTAPSIEVSLWLLVPIAALLTLIGAFFIWTIAKTRKVTSTLGLSPLIGAEAVVLSDLNPRGTIRLKTETWTAETPSGAVVKAGEKVRVVGMDGPILTVEPLPSPTRLNQ